MREGEKEREEKRGGRVGEEGQLASQGVLPFFFPSPADTYHQTSAFSELEHVHLPLLSRLSSFFFLRSSFSYLFLCLSFPTLFFSFLYFARVHNHKYMQKAQEIPGT